MESINVLVLGGGPGGTPAALALASRGQRVLLVERGIGLGGTCLFEGCIPSKIFREAARRRLEFRKAATFGLRSPFDAPEVDWHAIQERKRAILQQRSEAAAQNALSFPTLELVFGRARFESSRSATIESDGRTRQVVFSNAIVAVGSRPHSLPIPGAGLPGVVTSDGLIDAERLPQSLVVIGAGPVGVELAQIFHALGVEVTMLEVAPRILGSLDAVLAERLSAHIRNDGIGLFTGCKVLAIQRDGDALVVRFIAADGSTQSARGQTVLEVTGRVPDLEGLGLEQTAVRHTRSGIIVDEHLETDERGIFATGDAAGQPMFAHWATAQAQAVARHILGEPGMFPRPEHNSAVIFSFPELGMVGLTEALALERGIDAAVAEYDYAIDARAQIDDTDGLLRIVYDRTTLQVHGLHVLVEGAGDIMGEAAVAVANELTLRDLAAAIHPHPTLTEALGFAAQAALSHTARRKIVAAEDSTARRSHALGPYERRTKS